MTTSFSERAQIRIEAYGRHHRPGPSMRQTVVPEDLRTLPEFVELANERQAIEDARARTQQEHATWITEWQNTQNAATVTTRPTVRAAELALEAGAPLPELPVPVLVRPQSAAQWPLAELALPDHWQHLHRALDAEERSRVIEHGREPLA